MRQLVPAVAVLLVLAGLAAGVPAGSATAPDAAAAQAATPVVTPQNTTEYLAFEDGQAETTRYGNVTLDVASAAAMDAERTEAELVEGAAVVAFEDADNETERTRALEAGVTDLENRTAALQRRQQRTVQRYNDGQLSAERFLREIAVIHVRATALGTAADDLSERTVEQSTYTPPTSLRTRLGPTGRPGNVQAIPAITSGPVRESAAESIAGETTGTAVYVETTSDGVALARVAGGQYVREVFVGGEYDPAGPSQFDIDGAYDRARTLYAWADENRITTPSADGYGDTGVYRITIDHSHGRLVTFLDSATTNSFREVQEKRLSSLPTDTRSRVTSDDGLGVRVNVTHDTGPMEITTIDTDTNETVDARVTVDGQYVGRTGPTGALTVIKPSGPAVVNATAPDGRTVETTVRGD